MDYVKDMEKDLKNARPERVFITHSGCKQETVEKVRAYLEELGVFDEILETRAGGCLLYTSDTCRKVCRIDYLYPV